LEKNCNIKGMNKKSNILSELKNILVAQFSDNIQDVILFGSRARKTAKPNSDYDIIVILKNNYDWKFKDKLFNICVDFEIQHNIFLDVKIISEFELSRTIRGLNPIYKEALAHGIHL
jgi:predicted nucleotidyltransferase